MPNTFEPWLDKRLPRFQTTSPHQKTVEGCATGLFSKTFCITNQDLLFKAALLHTAPPARSKHDAIRDRQLLFKAYCLRLHCFVLLPLLAANMMQSKIDSYYSRLTVWGCIASYCSPCSQQTWCNQRSTATIQGLLFKAALLHTAPPARSEHGAIRDRQLLFKAYCLRLHCFILLPLLAANMVQSEIDSYYSRLTV